MVTLSPYGQVLNFVTWNSSNSIQLEWFGPHLFVAFSSQKESVEKVAD